jgi:CBS domain-containing protein
VKTVQQILGEKGTAIWAVAPETQVSDALGLMVEHNIGAVLVMQDATLVGILSERDFTRYAALRGREAATSTRVGEVMTVRPVCVTPAQTVDECMALMTDKRTRHLAVVDGGRVVGLVSIGDAVKATIAEQQFIIEQLEMYISN